MGLDILFAEDIRNALLAANEASAATAAVMAEVGIGSSTSPSPGRAVADSTELLAVSLRAYREGYRAALTTVALAFGIAPQAITLRQAEDSALRQAEDSALRPLDGLGTMQAQDPALQLRSWGELAQPHQLPESGEES